MPAPRLPLPALLAVVLLGAAASAPAQDPSTDRAIARAVDDLAEPSRARAAAATLLRHDPETVVPRLAALVIVPQRYVEPRQRVLASLFVLGRFGAAARLAVPALLNAVRDRDWGVADQALWALAEVGQYGDEAEREAWAAEIAGTHLTARVARERLRLGRCRDAAVVAAGIGAEEPAAVTAACLLLQPPLPGPLAGGPARESLRELLHARLAEALAPAEFPWQQPPLRSAASALAAAWTECAAAGVGDVLVGRGLLQHFDARLRRRGLDQIEPLGAASLAERAELLPLLFDADAEIRQVAAWAFGSFGARGLPALPGLRRLGGLDGDVGVRMACAAVADDVLQAHGSGEHAPLLAAIDARLRGRADQPLELPRDAFGCELLCEVLCGAEWTEAAVVRRLLPTPPAGTVVPAALRAAVLRYAVNTDPELRLVAATWLARHARPADADLERHLDAIAEFRGVVDPAFVEMLAWVRAGPGAAPTALLTALQHPSPRVVVRAACEWLQLPAAAPFDAGVARRLLEQVERGARDDFWLLGVDLGPEVRAAATLLLVAHGEDGVDRGALRLVAPPGVDRAEWLLADHPRAECAALARRLEAQVQELLEVPAGVALR
ncbi:MAG: hypothetical protein AB7O97_19725 [Planctomycetota bacterium]